MPESAIASLVTDCVARAGGERVLVLCPQDPGPLPAGAVHLRAAHDLDALPRAGRDFSLALAAGVLEHLEPEDGGALLAALRDLRAERLVVAVPAETDPSAHRSTWGLQEMLAHGLESRGVTGDGVLAVYGFDIDRYKKTPDWLNSRNWANPENWNRFRW